MSCYLLLLSLLLALSTSSVLVSAEYYERLLLQPLPPSSLLASFNFRSNTSLPAFEQQNFRYFPRSLGQILQHASTKELHLRFSLGWWDAESWGARPWGGAKEGGTGVELWAWVDAETDVEADARWKTLTNALSGLFCASLNFIDATRTTRPVMTFEPSGHHSNATLSNLHLLHGTLPREPVCTENLTPFLKLLPCKGKAGISSLLDGHRLFDASWQSMSIDVRPICPEDGSECILEIDQTVDMVLDIERSKRQRDNPIPRPVPAEDLICDTSKSYASGEACYPLDVTYEQPWSLTEIFGKSIKGSCPLSSAEDREVETVCLCVPNERNVFVSVGAEEVRHDNGVLRCYKLPENDNFDMVLQQQTLTNQNPLAQPLLYAERSFTGHGQERGGVQALLTNPSPVTPVEFVYLESLPWFMKPYIHTLRARTSRNSSSEEDIIKEIYYRPALDRRRGTQLEVRLVVPASSTAKLTYDFEKAILRYTEYPPDANRGFDVAPAIIRLISPSSSTPVFLRTTSLLLSLPTPDFSMPYNVIILTSTVMALAFGHIFNLLVRRFVGADEVERWDIGKLKSKLRGRFDGLRARFAAKGTKSE
ncbi:MAG: Subunit of the glycosylphosphatidylinositol transamidase complex-like protein [Candelina submexicana]|nr:MAG: Subunit of the glycosylphosphatidylinositol transamidase complex-like protein [Candelina submexicana]